MKLEDILKKKGYSEADLAGMKTLLEDAKFRGALEDEFGILESEREKLSKTVTEWSEWHQREALPTLEKEMKARQDAEADAAANRARLKALADQGLLKLEDQNNPPKDQKTPTEEFDPKKYKLVTEDALQTLVNAEGEAIALVQDIAAEHASLGLPRINFRALRKEAMETRDPSTGRPFLFEKYWEQKYKVPEARVALEEKRKADERTALTAEIRAQVVSEYANPATRPGVVSRASFLPQRKDDKSPMPWDANANVRKVERIDKAMKAQEKAS